MAHPRPSGPTPPFSATALRDEAPADPPIDEPVVLRSWGTPIEAELARSQLGAAGIQAELRDEHTVGMASHLSNAVGGVKVVVCAADVVRAREVLRALPDPSVRTTFRLRQSRAWMTGLGGLILGFVVGRAAAPGGAVLALAAAGAVAGAGMGRRWRTQVCVDVTCNAELAEGTQRCPGCGARVLGTIEHRDERLAAEEALRGSTDA